MDAWRDRFADTFPLLLPLRDAAAPLYGNDWPLRSALQRRLDAAGVRTASGLPLRLVAPEADGMSYEGRLYECGELEFRETTGMTCSMYWSGWRFRGPRRRSTRGIARRRPWRRGAARCAMR